MAVKEERWGEVESLAARALVDDPSSAAVQLVLGIAYRHDGKQEEALAAYAAAERLAAGKLPEVHLARGVLQMRDQGDCQGALRSFDQYERTAGPVLPQGSPVPRLIRECQEQVEQSRAAAEAARQMQSDADRKAAEAARPPASEPGAGQVAGRREGRCRTSSDPEAGPESGPEDEALTVSPRRRTGGKLA